MSQERLFRVIVGKIIGVPISKLREINIISYPWSNGADAIAVMEKLEGRGFDTLAYTVANKERENLTLAEMKVAVI